MKNKLHEQFCVDVGVLARMFCKRHDITESRYVCALVQQTFCEHGLELLKHCYFNGYDVLELPNGPYDYGKALSVFFTMFNAKLPQGSAKTDYTPPSAPVTTFAAAVSRTADANNPTMDDDPPDDGSTAISVGLLASPPPNLLKRYIDPAHFDKLRNVYSLFYRTCKVVFHDTWDHAKKVAQDNKLELETAKEVALLLKTKATEPAAMAVEGTSVSSQTFKEAVVEIHNQENKALKNQLATLTRRLDKATGKKPPSQQQKKKASGKTKSNQKSKNSLSGARRGAQAKQNSDNKSSSGNKRNNKRGGKNDRKTPQDTAETEEDASATNRNNSKRSSRRRQNKNRQGTKQN